MRFWKVTIRTEYDPKKVGGTGKGPIDYEGDFIIEAETEDEAIRRARVAYFQTVSDNDYPAFHEEEFTEIKKVIGIEREITSQPDVTVKRVIRDHKYYNEVRSDGEFVDYVKWKFTDKSTYVEAIKEQFTEDLTEFEDVDEEGQVTVRPDKPSQCKLLDWSGGLW